jgi:hypothetical protein
MIDFNVRDYMRSILPVGRYTFYIKNSQLKMSKSGHEMANIHLEVISDFRKGESIFKDFNIYHPGETAQRIAREELAALCAVVAIEDLKELRQLNDKVVDGEVIHEKYFDKNGNEQFACKIKKFFEPRGVKAIDIQAPDDKFDDDIAF